MSLAQSLIKSFIVEGRSPYALEKYGIEASDFTDEDRDFYNSWLSFWQRYQKTPQVETIQREVGAKLPSIKESSDYYLDRFKKSKQARLLRSLQDSLSDALEHLDIKEAATQLWNTQVALHKLDTIELVSTIGDHALEIMEEHDKRQRNDAGSIPFGFRLLDRYTYGPAAGDLVVIAGRPEAMKTYFMLNLALNAYQQGYRVLINTLEMLPSHIVRRLWAAIAGIHEDYFRFGRLSSFGKRRVLNIIRQIERPDDLILLHAPVKMNIDLLEATIEEKKPHAAYCDGAYMLMPTERVYSQAERLTNIIQQLKQIAIKYKIPVFLTWQLNRQTPKKAGAGTEHLYGSDAVGQYASWIFNLPRHRSSRGDLVTAERIEKEMKISKARDRMEKRKWNFEFDPKTSRFYELSAEELIEEEEQQIK